jgi:hypothetical protein
VPATLLAIASSRLCPINTRMSRAVLNSGRLTAAPWAILAAVASFAVTAGNSGSTKRGCTAKVSVYLLSDLGRR